jgi:hypothetical protein
MGVGDRETDFAANFKGLQVSQNQILMPPNVTCTSIIESSTYQGNYFGDEKYMWSLETSVSLDTLMLLTFGLDHSLLLECLVHCRRFSSIPDFYPSDASSIYLPSVMTNENIHRH